MNRVAGWLIIGLVALTAVGARAEDKPDGKKDRGTFRAQRAGWLLGMYLGEENGHPYPFIIQVDPQGEAREKGVRPGDELIRFQEEQVLGLKRVFEMGNRLRPGDRLTMWVRRGAQTLRFDLRVPKDQAPSEASKEKESAKKEKSGEKGSENSDNPDDKKKTKKKSPIVIKPIPVDN